MKQQSALWHPQCSVRGDEWHCEEQKSITEPVSRRHSHTLLSLCPHHTPAQWGNQGQQRTMMTMTWALQDSSPQRKREAQRLNGPGLMMMSQVCICPLELEWTQGMWADCGNVNSPVSLGLFKGENKSKYFQKSLPQLCM